MAGEATTHASPGRAVPERRRLPAGRARAFRLTDRDLDLLRFVAAHRFVLAAHVRVWMDGPHEVVAYRRLKGLVDAGLLRYDRFFHRQPGCYRVTGAGLAVIESELPRPLIDLRSYRHDTGVVWLYLDSHLGRFGPHRGVLSEREMRSSDQRPDAPPDSFAVPLGEYRADGKRRFHLPDVVVVRNDKTRVAFELELTLKSRRRLEAILAGYAAERRIEQIVYLTDSEAIANALTELRSVFGLDGSLRVYYLDGARSAYPGRWAWQISMAGELRR